MCPLAETVSVNRPFCSGARSRSVPGRAKPLRPPSVQRTRSASEETRTAKGAPAAAVMRSRPSVTKRTATGPPASGQNDSRPDRRRPAGARRRPAGRAVHAPSRSRRSSPPYAETRQRTPLAVDEERAATGLVQAVGDENLIATPVAVRRDHTRAHADVLDHRWRHVDPDRVRQRDRLVLAAHVDPRLVLALRQDPARVVAAVPADHDRPLRIAPAPLDRPHDLGRRRRSRCRAGRPCAA